MGFELAEAGVTGVDVLAAYQAGSLRSFQWTKGGFAPSLPKVVLTPFFVPVWGVARSEGSCGVASAGNFG